MLKQSGFTIIELMTAVALLAVMVVIGVPSFNSIINTNEAAANSNALLTALKVARSESTKRRQDIIVCASSNQTDCTNTNGWSDGWIVFEDADSDAVYDAGEEVIDTYNLSANFSITRASSGADQIQFRSTGISDSTVAQAFTVCKTGTASGRTLTVERSGLVTGANVNCP